MRTCEDREGCGLSSGASIGGAECYSHALAGGPPAAPHEARDTREATDSGALPLFTPDPNPGKPVEDDQKSMYTNLHLMVSAGGNASQSDQRLEIALGRGKWTDFDILKLRINAVFNSIPLSLLVEGLEWARNLEASLRGRRGRRYWRTRICSTGTCKRLSRPRYEAVALQEVFLHHP